MEIMNPKSIYLIRMSSLITVIKKNGLQIPLSKQMIKDIDGSEVVWPRLIDSPFLGAIPAERLSGGVAYLSQKRLYIDECG